MVKKLNSEIMCLRQTNKIKFVSDKNKLTHATPTM
jgi:hypothetical protein